ncbi:MULTISPECIES: hypothetical protein [Ramlibacter]|uniref:Uncharacterized protein n=1 Tax=Ramlibacter aquaticus TaxID=2780094 RepID=A0ABR9SH84_9BURK|nr:MULTISPECIES: hypothetical protein [Ramlibacter]MBE7941721.1 hypothetical protein [Ramlibacter aquaticus]
MADTPQYGITAVRYAGVQVVEAMMGLFDPLRRRWDSRPAPARVNEVVDRLVEGDSVVSVFPGDDGMEPGPEVQVDLLPGGTETLVAEGPPGRRLEDLPRF